MINKLGIMLMGIIFGFTLSKVEASQFDLIYGMFTATNFKLALVMILAIIIGFLGMRFLMARDQKTISGEKIQVSKKELKKYSLLGALIFGLGWGMSGACPGTVLAQIGEGNFLGIFTMLGMIFGTYLYGVLKAKKLPL